MAVWELRSAHYLNTVEPTKWTHEEVPRGGKAMRKDYVVPLYLHPDDPAEQTPPGSGVLIVAHKRSAAYPMAILFIGDPTPDMVPMDDEAEEITNRLKHKWGSHPIEGLPGDFSQSLISAFERQMAEIRSGSVAQPMVPNTGGVSREDFDRLQSQFAQLSDQLASTMAHNAELEAAKSERRV